MLFVIFHARYKLHEIIKDEKYIYVHSKVVTYEQYELQIRNVLISMILVYRLGKVCEGTDRGMESVRPGLAYPGQVGHYSG